MKFTFIYWYYIMDIHFNVAHRWSCFSHEKYLPDMDENILHSCALLFPLSIVIYSCYLCASAYVSRFSQAKHPLSRMTWPDIRFQITLYDMCFFTVERIFRQRFYVWASTIRNIAIGVSRECLEWANEYTLRVQADFGAGKSLKPSRADSRE